jgi:serine/threonine-protein kinase
MDPAPSDPLLTALRDSGRLTAGQVAEAERAFAERGAKPAALAERLNGAGILTRYQFKKLQAGRTADLLFGSYLILDKIGEGGMGKVYRAVQLRMNRLVALKVVRPQLMANKTVVKRYEREAAAAARLDHPNIVKLYDAEMVDGRYFLAMEYVEGLDLARLVKQFGQLPYQEACEYIRQSALGLAHAHRLSLIHRDIKPSNLLVYGERALPGTNGKAALKILDMGLVRSFLEEDAGQPDLTRDGTVVGTPDYMSPEQAKNSSQVTPQADIYSLGCTLYYLLTAKPPYPDGSPVEKLIKHQLDQFPDVRKLVPSVPAGLARVLADMTARRVTDRTATADAVAHAVAPYTPNGEKFDLFSPSSGSASGGPRSERYEEVDLTPAKTAPGPARSSPAVATPTATRTTGPASTRTARPKAIPLPAAEPPSAESLPSGDVRRTPRPAGTVGTVRVRKPSRKAAARRRRRFPLTTVIGCVVAGVVAVALVFLLFHRPSPPLTPTPTPPTPTPTPPPVAESPYRALEDLLPDNPSAVLFGHPKAYFDRFALEPKPSGPITRAFNRLRNRYLFDPRKLDRIAVAFTTDPKGFVVAGEGKVLTPEWVEELDRYPGSTVKVATDPSGVKRLTFPLTPIRKRETLSDTEGAVLPGPHATFLLADRDEALNGVVRRTADPAPPTGVPSDLAKELRAAVPREPLLFFAAAGGYRLPSKEAWAKGDTLASLGVSVLTAEVRLDEKFAVELTVTGDTLERIRDFLNVELPRRLTAWSPDLKPLAAAAVATAPRLATTSGQLRMTLSVSLEWETVQAALETLLTPYSHDR